MTDAALATRARRGEQAALEALLDRHLASTWQLANVVHHDRVRAVAAVVDAVTNTLSTPPASAVHPLPARGELLVAARAGAVAEDPAPGRSLRGLDQPLATDAAGRTRAAFERLPEGWRTVLWLRLVEGLGADDTAAVLGLSVSATEQLLDRALAGWLEGTTRQLLAATTATDCRRALTLLGGYADHTLADRDHTRVRRHLDACERCRAGLEELDDLAPVLRRTAPALPVGLRAAVIAAWAERTRAARGPFGMVLPGGRPVPAWAERVLAGATAAAIALGITAAALHQARGTRTARDLVVMVPGQSSGAADGESALGDLPSSPEGAGTGSAPPPATSDDHQAPPTVGVAGPSDDAARALPRRATGTDGPPPSPPRPPHTEPPAPTPEEPAPEPTPPASPGVTVRIDGDTGVSLGEGCTGAEVLGIVVGCEPADESTLPLPGI